MWVELDDAEIGKIIEAVGPGPISDKLSTRPHRFTGAFASAAEAIANEMEEKLVVEQNGIIERGDFGAYVMAWLWVSDKDADVPAAFEDYDVSEQVSRRASQLSSFRLFETNYDNGIWSAKGTVGTFEWHFQRHGKVWTLNAFDQSGRRGDWFHIEEFMPDERSPHMSDEEVFASIFDAFGPLMARDAMLPSNGHPLFWRKYLELYAFGEITAEYAASMLNVTVEMLDERAEPIRKQIEAFHSDGVRAVFSGPGMPRFDLEQETTDAA